VALILSLPDPAATEALGRTLGRTVPPGTVLLLRGPLGAGKTSLVQGVARGLGIPDSAGVRSPSYALMRVHEEGRMPLVHVDLYRLEDPDELSELGLEEWFDGDALIAVEWVDRFDDAFTDQGIEIELRYRDGVTGRDVTLAGTDDATRAVVEEVRGELGPAGAAGGA
jgi:tRNA threonylcarbamoyladenosine biosynthesis protein TsaE